MGHFATILTVLLASISYTLTAFWFGINDVTTIDIINRLPLLLSPAPFVYGMTLLVCYSLFHFLWQIFKDRKTVYAVTGLQTILIIVACFMQINFFFTWHSGKYMPSFIMLALQLVILFTLHITYPIEQASIKRRGPIALWFSWQLFFTFVIAGYIALYYEWDGFGLSTPFWAVLLLTLCTAIALHVRFHHYDKLTPTVVAIGFLGIIINNGLEQLFVFTATLFLLGVLIIGTIFIKKNKTT